MRLAPQSAGHRDRQAAVAVTLNWVMALGIPALWLRLAWRIFHEPPALPAQMRSRL